MVLRLWQPFLPWHPAAQYSGQLRDCGSYEPDQKPGGSNTLPAWRDFCQYRHPVLL